MGRAKLDPNNPLRFTHEELARLDAMTPEEIQHNAETDPDNPPLTEEELDAVRVARKVQAIRKRRGLSQVAFAEAYRFSAARLRDWEQGRRRPDDAALAYLDTIDREPEAVARALAVKEPAQ